MRNLIIFLSAFTATILIVLFMSAPAHADFGGGGGGGATGGMPNRYSITWKGGPPDIFGATPYQVCSQMTSQSSANNDNPDTDWQTHIQPSVIGLTCHYKFKSSRDVPYEKRTRLITDNYVPDPDIPDPDIPDPDIPDPDKPSPDCNVCNAVYELNLKITNIANENNTNNYDMRVTVNNMQQTINNISNSLTDLSINQEITNNNTTEIAYEISKIITNIENNNITNNEIKNEVNNIGDKLTEYSLKLGDIDLALGDIDLSLKNTNRLAVDLGLDLDFIKNNLVNGGANSKDYTGQLNEIVDLLKECEPTAETPCPDDPILKKLKEMQDFMEADFVPDTGATEIDVQDLTDIKLDRNLIKFGVAQCPPDEPIDTLVNGFVFKAAFKHQPLCSFFTMLAPFIKAFGGFSAALILGGGLRR